MAEDQEDFEDDILEDDDDFDYSDDPQQLGCDEFDHTLAQTPKQRIEDYLDQRELRRRLEDF